MSSTLLERIRSRQPEAWERMVCSYGPIVYRWCRQCDVARDDAPDVVQEVFASVASHIEGFHRDRPVTVLPLGSERSRAMPFEATGALGAVNRLPREAPMLRSGFSSSLSRPTSPRMEISEAIANASRLSSWNGYGPNSKTAHGRHSGAW